MAHDRTPDGIENATDGATARSASEDPRTDPSGKSSAKEGSKSRSKRTEHLRALTALAVFAVVGVGLALHTGTGTPSSFGWNLIATICPLGALESLFGAWVFVPRVLVMLAVALVVVLLVGKAFCAWVCPVPHVKDLFSSKKQKRLDTEERQQAASTAYARWKAGERLAKRPKPHLDSRHGVLVGALLSAMIFGFPVFCLVCPVGLTFGTFILFWRLVQFNEVSIGLLAFPAVVIVEVVLLRRWCGTLCPMGALMSLVSSANRTFRPTVDRTKCLRDTEGAACRSCDAACPEHIDPHLNLGQADMSECIRCRSCVNACPAHAITLPFLPRNSKDGASEEGGGRRKVLGGSPTPIRRADDE